MTGANEGVESSDCQLRRDIGFQQLFFLSFGGYCAISIGAFAFVYFLMLETKGRSLEEIERDPRKKSVVTPQTEEANPS